MNDHIPQDQCKLRFIYKIQSRNLNYGVYDGKGGFIGIREKFDFRYLSTEYHWGTGAPHGTVRPKEELHKIPEWIPIKEDLATVCGTCGIPVIFISLDNSKHTPGRWEHIPRHKFNEDTEEAELIDNQCPKVRPTSLSNSYLFDYLDKLEKEQTL